MARKHERIVTRSNYPTDSTTLTSFLMLHQLYTPLQLYAKQGKRVSSIFAKSRIAPIKGTTILRLELLVVLIGVRAAQFVMKRMELEHAEVCG